MSVIDREGYTALLQQLVSIPSPYFHEDDVMAFALDWLRERGLPARLHEFYEPRETGFHGKNVSFRLDSGRPGPVLYAGGHLDTVGLCSGWTRDPYAATVEDGRMYGVGVLDMKAGCAAVMAAAEAFYRLHGKDFEGSLICQFVSDEEGPYGLGTVFAIKDDLDGVGSGVDFAVIAEPSSGFTSAAHPCLCLGARGGYNYKIGLQGKAAHAASPQLGINAVSDAARVILQLEDMPRAEDPQLGRSELCVIGVKSSEAACSVPESAQIEVFQHTVRGESVETMQVQAEEAIRKAGIRSKASVSFRQTPVEGDARFDGGFAPYCTDPQDPYVKMLSGCAEDVCGKEPNISYMQSIGDFNHYGGMLGIPTVLLGPAGENFHGPDEWVDLDSALDIAEILYAFLEKALAPKQK